MPNLQSSLNKVGKIVTQYFLFSYGNERTIKGIITSGIKQNKYTELPCTNGVTWNINAKNVDAFKTTSEGIEKGVVSHNKVPTVDRIYHFQIKNKNKLTIENIITSEIKQGEFTKMTCTDGSVWSINPDNVDCFESIPENENQEIVISKNVEIQIFKKVFRELQTGYQKLKRLLSFWIH